MKRFVSLFLVISIFAFCIVPASAASFNGSGTTDVYDILDYLIIGDNDNTIIRYGSSFSIPIPLPTRQSISYVDFLVNLNPANTLLSVKCGNSSSSTFSELNFNRINGTNLFRVFGNIPMRFYTKLDLNFEFSGSSVTNPTIVTFYEFNVRNNPFDFVELGYNVSVSALGEVHEFDVAAGDGHSIDFPQYVGSDPLPTHFTTYITIENWESYDFLDFYCGSYCYGITSLLAYTDDMIQVPLSSSYTNIDADLNETENGIVIENPLGGYYVGMTLDLRGLNRSKHNSITIEIRGLYDAFTYSHFYSNILLGYLESQEPSQFALLINRLEDWFGQLISGNSDSESAVDDFVSSSQDQSDRIEYSESEIQSIEKPFLGDMDFSVENMVDPNVLTHSTAGISAVLSNSIFIKVLFMSLTLALAGFILYGKK